MNGWFVLSVPLSALTSTNTFCPLSSKSLTSCQVAVFNTQYLKELLSAFAVTSVPSVVLIVPYCCFFFCWTKVIVAYLSKSSADGSVVVTVGRPFVYWATCSVAESYFVAKTGSQPVKSQPLSALTSGAANVDSISTPAKT